MSKRLDSGQPRSMYEYGTPQGDTVAWSFIIRALDVRKVVLYELLIHVTVANQIGVAGGISQLSTALSVIEHAKDAVRSYHMQKDGMTIPGKDCSVEGLTGVDKVTIEGPIEDRIYALACLDAGKSTLSAHHSKELIHRPDNGLTIRAL